MTSNMQLKVIAPYVVKLIKAIAANIHGIAVHQQGNSTDELKLELELECTHFKW